MRRWSFYWHLDKLGWIHVIRGGVVGDAAWINLLREFPNNIIWITASTLRDWQAWFHARLEERAFEMTTQTQFIPRWNTDAEWETFIQRQIALDEIAEHTQPNVERDEINSDDEF